MTTVTRSPLMPNYFNFDFESAYQANFPEPSPPALANGPSLLDDQESSAFADFFEKVGSGGNVDSFLFEQKATTLFDPKLPDPLLWGWHDESSTQYPYQHGSEELGERLSPITPTSNFHHSNSAPDIAHMPPPPPTSSAPPTSQSIVPSEITLNPFDKGDLLVNSNNNGKARPRSATVDGSVGSSLQWGSDPHFNLAQGYTNPDAPNPMSSTDEINSRISGLVEKTKGSTAASNTSNSSPGERPVSNYKANSDDTEDDSSRSGRTPSPGRRKSDMEMTRKHSGSPIKKIKHRKSDASPKISKKKVSKRDNLSETQKRENHIQSEQKRRNLIRQGFDDLCGLVPELRGGGYSKSAVLVHAATFLEQILEGNKILKIKLQELENTNRGW